MFENLTKIVGIGAALAFLLALAHECVFLFLIGVDVRVVPYEVGDVVTRSALMLPSILGFLLVMVIFSATLHGRVSKWYFALGLVTLLILYSAGYYGKLLLILLGSLVTLLIPLLSVPLQDYYKQIQDNLPLIAFLTIWLVITNAIGDAALALTSDHFSKAKIESDPNDVYLIRSISRGFIVRNSSNDFHFVDRDSLKYFSLMSAP